MDARALLDNFGIIAEAPVGIQRLRGFILDLAVRGRLVAQNPSDEPANILLHSIAENGLVGPSSLTEPIRVGDALWKLPNSWCWVRLKQISDFAAGRTPPTNDPTYWADGSGYHWVSIGDMPDGGNVLNTARSVSIKARHEIFRGEPNPVGTILMSFKLTIGKVARLSIPAFHNEAIVSIASPFQETQEYLFRVLPLLTRMGNSRAAIMGNTLNKRSLTNLLVPLPPLTEQQRIVTKIDELMKLSGDLEIRQNRRYHATTLFRRAALHRLTEPETSSGLHRAWERVSTNWPAITDHPDSLTDVRQTILQLAVEGRLTYQDSSEEPASVILQDCHRRKRSTLNPGAIRGRSALPEISPGEVPYPLPSGWALERLDNWCDIAGGVAKGRRLVGREVVSLPYLRVANVKAGYLLLDEVKKIEVPLDEVDRYSLQAGDVLLTEGGDWDKLGRSAIWTGEIAPCLHQNHVFRARPLSAELLPEWVCLFTNSEAGRKYFQSKAKRTTNLASINMTELRSTPLPVPPVAEQRRILNRLAEIEALLSRLAVALTNARAVHARIADALVKTG